MDTGSGYRGRIPFSPLQLTVEEQERCQERTLQLLDQTLRSYDERGVAANGSPLHHSRLTSARWKRVKTQLYTSLYCERRRGGPQDLHMPWGNWKSPLVLLAVGTIHSCLDDVMLGLTTQSFGDMQLRAASMASQEIRGAMLAKISGPTEEDPFNSQSVVWMVGEQKWPLSMVVNPRDFVNLCACGIITTANGDRIGYEIVQPAQLPQCPELPGSIKRGKFMYGALFREENGAVDVYIYVHVETMGAGVNAVMMNGIWSSILGFWKAPSFSEEKKLEWCVITNAVKRASSKRKTSETKSRTDLPSCSRCTAVLVPRNQSEYSRGTITCAACASILCFSCSVKRTIKTTTGSSKGAVTRNVAIRLCKNCLKLIEKESAAKIAWEQYQYRLMYSATDTCSSSQPLWGLADDSAMFMWSPDRHFSISDVYSDGEETWLT
ncbi:hypothetical protein GN244_ATG13228 [Phytophthora infestans]|nr:hypothetical protein GN244_ATG13228 [Phytophthora infestans]KAF4128384.1 hypothetical protein GN958_ATG22462 [Phytophthora infestans]